MTPEPKKVETPEEVVERIFRHQPVSELQKQCLQPFIENAIIAERKQNPAAWPYEMLEKAQAFLEAYSARPQVISPYVGEAKVNRARADANAA